MDLIREVHLEIDELVFTGLGAVDAAGVASVFERELGRLVRAQGLPLEALRPERVAEAVAALAPLPATGSARRLGLALANALFAGLSGGTSGGASGQALGSTSGGASGTASRAPVTQAPYISTPVRPQSPAASRSRPESDRSVA